MLKTVGNTLPGEIDYLRRYDLANERVDNFLEMPDHRFDLMLGLLRQNEGHFSKAARERALAALTDAEVSPVEGIYPDLLLGHG
jgi:hypothetical protein